MEKDFIQNRNAEIQELAQELLKKPVYDLAIELATYIIKEKEKPNVRISVTQDEYDQITNTISSLFRVRGIRPTGELETRGRRRKDSSD